MKDYILLMYQDATNTAAAGQPERWEQYFAALRATGQFDGGSAIGRGERFRKDQLSRPADSDLNGFIRVRAASLEDARRFLDGNPVYEAGGTVELRELPRD